MAGAIEAGGTKFVCAVGTNPDDITTEEFPTTTPYETVARALAFFARHPPVAAIGIGSFGPVDLATGTITSTPKLAWRNYPLASVIRSATGAQVFLDTDVNAAALGEHRWGAAQDVDSFLYLTIGTGIGGGGMLGGRLLHGLIHPEMGHIRIPHSDPFPGVCPYHGDCLEGLASGPAIEKRWNTPGHKLPAGHPAWALEARYLALAVVNFICTLSPQRIILGGGVMQRAELLPLIRAEVRTVLNDYIQSPAVLENIDSYIVQPALGKRAGVLGALTLAL
ncbi:MAG: ROK family protein [Acidobacteriota bacterium]|nr:ROK family protein [Acidobacteriota bacterium]